MESVDDFGKCYDDFLAMSTLDDTPSREQAQRVFRLGQYYVLGNWEAIRELLDERMRKYPISQVHWMQNLYKVIQYQRDDPARLVVPDTGIIPRVQDVVGAMDASSVP